MCPFLQVFDEDTSVAQAVHQQTEPVSLEQCLQAFTREEQLSGDEKYYCPKCATHQPATKKLQIWRLPPILVELLFFQGLKIDNSNIILLFRLFI